MVWRRIGGPVRGFFFSCIEGSASIGRWEPADRIKIATLRLTGAAKLFYTGCPEPHAADVTWDNFKDAFYLRFRDAHSDKFHFMQLQTARQRKGESPREFADRCRAVANKVMCKVDDPAAQRFHRKNADSMMLAVSLLVFRVLWVPKWIIKPHEVKYAGEHS